MGLDPKAVRPYLRKTLIGLNLPITQVLKLLRFSLRFDDSFWNEVDRNRPALIALYHGELLPLTLYGAYRKKLATVVSLHADGEIIAKVLERLGYKVVRGSTDEGRYKGGSKALREIIKLLGNGYLVAITVDGPKGPCCKVKDGILYASWFSKRPIYPVRIEVKGLHLPTWDRFLVPFPFAEIKIKLGNPIWVEDKTAFPLYREKLEKELLSMENLRI
ncbi:MAG: hypothetical protein DSZ31_00770 [Gammaproteobacteria bacterium]|nr:MAG: hypothetical protein DSZ31_00770 [Gammaproteobacteria bacterium]